MSNWLSIEPEGNRNRFIDEFKRIYAGMGIITVPPVSKDAKDGDHILLKRTVGGKQKTHIILRVGSNGKLVPEGPFAIRKKQGRTIIPSIYRDFLKAACEEIIRTL